MPEPIMDPEPVAITPTPVLAKQAKAAPEMTPQTSAVDKEQRAQSIVLDLEGGIATLNVAEGEEIGGEFRTVAVPQKEVSLDDFAAALANKSKAAVKQALADFTLATVTAP